MTTRADQRPPTDPSSSEADEQQLLLAREQGDAYGKALKHMVSNVAEDGGQQPAGPYVVGYAIEEAEGMYAWSEGELVWQEPREENLHVEITVRDGADGRFVPGLQVRGTLITAEGRELGTHEHPLLWHPMLYHYGRNWKVPGDGSYTLRVQIDPPQFMRHDEVNGKRFTETISVEFRDVRAKTGQGSILPGAVGEHVEGTRHRDDPDARVARVKAVTWSMPGSGQEVGLRHPQQRVEQTCDACGRATGPPPRAATGAHRASRPAASGAIGRIAAACAAGAGSGRATTRSRSVSVAQGPVKWRRGVRLTRDHDIDRVGVSSPTP